mgnify:FL=1
MKYVDFPRPLATPVQAMFYRFRGEGPMKGGQQTLLKTPNRFTSNVMELKKDINEVKLGGLGDLWTQDEIQMWIETEFPSQLPWSRSFQELLVVALPHVEIPHELFEYKTHTFGAVSEQGELGFINPVLQKCWEPVDFDSDRTKPIKAMAKEAGWVFTEYLDDPLAQRNREQRNKRGDDGKFDQITHSFYAGARRCGWCGSSSVIPRFLLPTTGPHIPIEEEPAFHCMACEADGGDSIDDRNALELSNYE